jgi:chlorobactene glucosyltransferase
MLYQYIIAAGLAVFLFNLLLNLKTLKKPDIAAKIPAPAPFISVLVPARDEEANIRECLESLQKQDYPNYEILVLDDNSADRTAEIVAGMAAADPRIRLIRGETLPEDWAGKPFACYQLAKQAGGSWLLFVDADTIHAPHMLRSVLELAVESKASMLSGFPRQLAPTLPLKIVMPLMYFVILGWLPLWWLRRFKKPKPALAIGQFLMFPRDEYWRIGGHEVVQSRIAEDVWLGIEVTRQGGCHVAVDLSPVVACNMYRDIGAAWHGLGRSIYSVTAISPVGLFGLMLAAAFL